MSGLIRRKSLDEAFTALRFDKNYNMAHWGDRKDWCLLGYEIERLIEEAPAVDAVEVVRCADCVDWEPPPENEQLDGSTTGHCRAMYGTCKEQETDMNWFCADGERKR